MNDETFGKMFPKPEWEQKLERNVKRGTIFLDMEKPGWHNLVNIDDLTMSSAYRCICGWVFRQLAAELEQDSGYDAFVQEYADEMGDEHLGVRYGFESPSAYSDEINRDYSALAEIWLEVIQKRRADEGTVLD